MIKRCLVVGLLWTGCTHGGSNDSAKEPVAKAPAAPQAKAKGTASEHRSEPDAVAPQPVLPVAEVHGVAAAVALAGGGAGVVPPPRTSEALSEPAAPAPSPCTVFERLPGPPPVALVASNVVVTRFLKPCVTANGQRGYDKTTPYLAMGFPCSGGNGRIEYKGHYASPMMVSFILGTDCPLEPASRDQVQQLVQSKFGLPSTVKLVAYTPFVVQYWEVPQMVDADVGYSLDLRSPPAKEGLWRRFLKSEPIRVHLYGRENTWVPGDTIYYVEAELKLTGKTTFQLQTVQVRSLGKEEIAAVRQRCEALRPSRNCGEVF